VVEVVVTDEFGDWYADLPDGHRESVIHSVGLLEQMGTQLPFPHSSDLKGSRYALRELRVKAQGAQIRIAYAFGPERGARYRRHKAWRRPILPLVYPEGRRRLGRVSESARSHAVKTHRWRDIRDAGGKVSQKRLAEIDAAVAEEASSFRELREALGITQTELAKLANMTQSEVSKFETREDHRIERMREMIEALGGKLEVIAVLGEKRVRVA
jgi:DNA-binding transcriptional regulator YiaG